MAQQDDTRGRRGSRIRVIGAGAVAGLAWLTVVAVWLWPAGGGLVAVVMAVVPLVLIGFATLAALSLRDLRVEAIALRQDRDRLRDTLEAVRAGADTDGTIEKTPTVQPPPAAKSRMTPPAPEPDRGAARPAQAALPLGAGTPPALSLPDLIRALHFPETPEDRAGLRALQRALRDHKARLVVQAAQDMLTLLSQDGIYMDDMIHDRAPPALWRRFAAGERRAEVMAVGAIHDPDALALCRVRLRDNTVWRDTAHHFLRRFDQMLGGLVPDLEDAAIEALSETRSARAFMLVGRAADVFGPEHGNIPHRADS